MKIFIMICLSMVLSSCALVSEKDCVTRNWYQQAVKDAQAGRPKSRFGDYKESCARYGIEIDQEEYVQGFESTLKKK